MRRDVVEERCHSALSCYCSHWMCVACEEEVGCPSRTGCWAATWRQRLGQESKVLGLAVDLLKAVQTPFLTLRSVGIACWVNEAKRQERRGRRFFA